MTLANIPRLNALIVLAGPFVIILAVKLFNLLLPEKYYFSFSSFVAGSDSAFIVDPPTVSGRRLCALAKKYGIDANALLKTSYTQCSEELAPVEDNADRFKRKVTNEQRDEAYRVAFSTDAQSLELLAGHVRTVMPSIPEGTIEALLAEYPTAPKAYDGISQKYTRLISLPFESPIYGFLDQRYATVFATGAQDNGADTDGEAAENAGESQAEAPRDEPSPELKEAAELFARQLTPDKIIEQFRRISASDVNEALEGYGDLGRNVGAHYDSLISSAIRAQLHAAFVESGVRDFTEESVRAKVLNTIAQERSLDYIIAAFFRFLPVFAVGALLGFLGGRHEALSIGVAGALAAFLLIWPVLLLWDTVVQSSWNEQKPIFAALYAAYIFVLFVTARAGAICGAYFREKSGRTGVAPSGYAQKAPVETGSTAIREVSFNVAASLVANILVFAWNVMMPFIL